MLEFAIIIYLLFGVGFGFSTAVSDKGSVRFLIAWVLITFVWPALIGLFIGAGMDE